MSTGRPASDAETIIYGAADVAQLLRVTRAAVSNYRARHDDTPAPAFTTPDGRLFWTVDGMRAWWDWQARRGPAPLPDGNAMVEKLRAELSTS